jgi:FolB domain-containing protein
MDTITIDTLAVSTRIGVTDAERESPQTVHVTVDMETDTRQVAAADRLESAIDYALVVEAIKQLAMTERRTIERFAEDIAASVLQDTPATHVRVTVAKFPFPQAKEARVTIERGRKEL